MNNLARAATLLTAVLILSASLVQAQGVVSVRPVGSSSANLVLVVDGKVVEADIIEMQRGWQVMVWLRDLEKLGWGKVEPVPQSGQICFKGQGVTLTFTKNEGVAMVNTLPVRLPINTYLSGDHLMVPLSFVAKALGYQYDCSTKTVATVSTTGIVELSKQSNSISGKITYNNHGLSDVLVRAVTNDFTVIGNAYAKTESDGSYILQPLPDGECMAYIYCGDNPNFFNRASEIVTLGGGKTTQVAPIALGRIMASLRPKSNERVSLAKGSVEFAWISCEGADSYKLALRKDGVNAPVFEAISRKLSFAVPSNKLSPGCAYEAEVTALSATGDYLGGTVGPGGKPWAFTVAK